MNPGQRILQAAIRNPLCKPTDMPQKECYEAAPSGVCFVCTVSVDSTGMWWDLTVQHSDIPANMLDPSSEKEMKRFMRLVLKGVGKPEADRFHKDRVLHLRRPLNTKERKYVSKKLGLTKN